MKEVLLIFGLLLVLSNCWKTYLDGKVWVPQGSDTNIDIWNGKVTSYLNVNVKHSWSLGSLQYYNPMQMSPAPIPGFYHIALNADIIVTLTGMDSNFQVNFRPRNRDINVPVLHRINLCEWDYRGHTCGVDFHILSWEADAYTTIQMEVSAFCEGASPERIYAWKDTRNFRKPTSFWHGYDDDDCECDGDHSSSRFLSGDGDFEEGYDDDCECDKSW